MTATAIDQENLFDRPKKTITLQQLILRNFKGFTYCLTIDGDDADISGQNATGKTTLADAFSWLLFDKDSLGRSDFEIKNLNATGEQEHGLEHSVEGILSVNGIEIGLKKVYREIWTKKRGSPQSIFTGNTTDYFIDGVPVQKKEYVANVAELAGEESVFRLLTSPVAFPSLHWQKQRAILLEVCGDLTDAQVIKSDSNLLPLAAILGKRTIDDHRKVVTARRAEINKELERIPVRIDEVRRGLPDITGLNHKAIIEEISMLETSLNDAKLKLQGIDTGGHIAELSKKLAGINADIQKIELAHYNNTMMAANKMTLKISEINEKAQSAERKAKSLKDYIARQEENLNLVDKQLQSLRDKWVVVDGEIFTDTTEDICPACGQSLPSERVQEAREKALAEFNRNKAEQLTEIETKGKTLAVERDRLKDEIEKSKAELILLRPLNNEESLDLLDALIAERDSTKRLAEDYSGIKEWTELQTQKAETEEAIKREKGYVKEALNAEALKVTELEARLKDAKARADMYTRREQGEGRIEELKGEEKKLTIEFEDLERQLYLCELFIKTKVSLLTDQINSKFEIARFKLFNVLVNGGIEECCEITVNGIGYNSNLNSGARINVGLDVCRTLARHYGLLVPIFVDNAETVCKLIRMDTQVIRLIVSEKDIALKVKRIKKN